METPTPNEIFTAAREWQQARHGLRNQTRALAAELAYNLDLIQAFRVDSEELSGWFDDEVEADNYPDHRDILAAFVHSRRSTVFKIWLESKHNLDQLGWLIDDRDQYWRVWDYLARIYHRMDVLEVRLALHRKNEIEPAIKDINVQVQFRHLRTRLAIAYTAIDGWLKAPWPKRLWQRLRKLPF